MRQVSASSGSIALEQKKQVMVLVFSRPGLITTDEAEFIVMSKMTSCVIVLGIKLLDFVFVFFNRVIPETSCKHHN